MLDSWIPFGDCWLARKLNVYLWNLESKSLKILRQSLAPTNDDDYASCKHQNASSLSHFSCVVLVFLNDVLSTKFYAVLRSGVLARRVSYRQTDL